MSKSVSVIDIGKRGAWNPVGLKRLDDEVIRITRSRAATKHGAQALRWYVLDLVTSEPTPSPFEDFEAYLRDEEPSLWRHFDKHSRKNSIDDQEAGRILGYATDAPVRRKEWRNLREKVFSRIGLDFGSPPKTAASDTATCDIGNPEAGWRYDAMRLLDGHLRKLVKHHAATEFGAHALRWHVWSELTIAPRAIGVSEVETQFENADKSLLAEIGPEFRRAKGHLDDEAIARLLGFSSKRPIMEGYYRQLREEVYQRIAHGFGTVHMPEVDPNPNAFRVGRQGAWNRESLCKLDAELSKLVRSFAKTEDGAQTLRWYYLDQITADPEPVDLSVIEQRLKRLGATILDLFGALHRTGPPLGDSRIARFADLKPIKTLSKKDWSPFRKRVVERIGPNVLPEGFPTGN